MILKCHAFELVAGGISRKNLQTTYETLSQGQLQNQFIEFANDLKLLTSGTVTKSIYVRESYETVTKLISDAMTKEEIRNFVVTGTMGIGKTFYLHYFLWVLFTRQTNINNNVEISSAQ